MDIDKKKKREHILLSAINVFASKGFKKTTINDIAYSSGIGKGTVYEYFKSKEDIIHKAFLFFSDSMISEFENIITSNLNAKDKFVELMNSFCHITDGKSGELLDVIIVFWAEGLRNNTSKGLLKENMRQMYISYRKLLTKVFKQGISEKIFKEDIDPDSLAIAIIGMLDGLMVQWILDKEKIDISKAINSIIDMTLNGMEKNTEK